MSEEYLTEELNRTLMHKVMEMYANGDIAEDALLDLFEDTINPVIDKLEKENTELKSGCSLCYRKDKEQLTKAKEIIKDLLLMAKVEHLKERYESVEEAEQFLKEIK